MKRLPGSMFFIAAAVYLTTQGDLDLLVLPAVLACAACAVIALSRSHIWALSGGVGLISVSLVLQISMNYWCNYCLKTDLLILAAVVSLALIQRGGLKIPSRIMAGLMSALLLGLTAAAAPPLPAASSPEIAIGEEATVLVQEKPALLFNPNCPPCREVVRAVIEIDPMGKNWLAVQSGGDRTEGREYLEEQGYRGPEVIYQQSSHAVPALLAEIDGEIVLIRGKDEIVSIIAERG